MNTESDETSVNVPNDPDFELLERYLDKELTGAEVLGLQERLTADPELTAALARMSADYAVRRAVWQSMEPADADAMKLVAGVGRSARQAELRRRVSRLTRFAGAAAACIALGFLAGWVGRGGTVARASDPAAQASTNLASAADHRDEKELAPAEQQGIYQVALTDESGNITAVQKFANIDDARNFAADVGRWQARQQQIENGQAVMTSSGL